MGLLDALEQAFVPAKQMEKKQVALKEIICKRKGDDYVKKVNTPVLGVEYKNPDGSLRQDALKKLKTGEKVRLLWNPGGGGKKDRIYLVRGRSSRPLSMSDCFGRLNDQVTKDVVRWVKSNISVSARVSKIAGGTRKRQKLGCTIELRAYRETIKT